MKLSGKVALGILGFAIAAVMCLVFSFLVFGSWKAQMVAETQAGWDTAILLFRRLIVLGGLGVALVVAFVALVQQHVSQEQRQHLELDEAWLLLKQASRLKGDFIVNLNHELLTPLNHVLGFSEVLLDGIAGELNDRQRDYLSRILSGGRQLHSLVQNFIDLSSAIDGSLELRRTRLQLRPILESAIDAFQEKARQSRVALDLELEPGAEVELQADEGKLAQVMVNLLSNAVKFTPGGGRVRVKVRRLALPASAGRVEIAVEDAGPGIKPEDLNRIFQEFVQLQPRYTRSHQGAGLGLAVTKWLVEMHGGSIRAESELGKGSRFIVELPLGGRAS